MEFMKINKISLYTGELLLFKQIFTSINLSSFFMGNYLPNNLYSSDLFLITRSYYGFFSNYFFLIILRLFNIFKNYSRFYVLTIFPIIPNTDFEFFSNHFYLVLTLFLTLTLISGTISLFFIFLNLKLVHNLWYFIIPLITISILFFFSPVFMLICSIICSGFLINLTYSSFFVRWISNKLSSNDLIILLNNFGILPFFFRIYSYVFSVSSANQFFLILIVSHLLSFLYVLFSRFYIFIFLVLTISLPWIIYVLLLLVIFFCLVGLLVRLLINFSIVITHTTLNVQHSLWESFLLVEPLYDPSKVPPSVYVGPFARYNPTTNITHNHGMPPRLSLWKGFGLGIGVCTLGVSCVIGYYTYQSVIESRKQTLEAQKQTLEAQKQTFEAQEANRLKRWEMASQNPKNAPYVFEGHPDELQKFQTKK